MQVRNTGSGLEHLRQPSDMTRSIRLEFAGTLYPVTSPGDRRKPIYENDAAPGVAVYRRALHRAAKVARRPKGRM